MCLSVEGCSDSNCSRDFGDIFDPGDVKKKTKDVLKCQPVVDADAGPGSNTNNGTVPKKKIKRKICSVENCKSQAYNKFDVCVKHGAQVKKCSVKDCTNNRANNGICKRHGAKVSRPICTVHNCNNLVQRQGLCRRHGANDFIQKCKHEGCDKLVVNNGACQRHGGTSTKCSVVNCEKQAQYAGLCISHGGKVVCSIESCGANAVFNGKCRSHVPYDERPFKCEKCDCRAVFQSDITKHIDEVHNSLVECKVKDCTTRAVLDGLCIPHIPPDRLPLKCNNCHYGAVYPSQLKTHLERTHDIGEHQCEYCAYNRNKLIEYTCPKWVITSQICRGCHDKATGKTVRKEVEWSNYIDQHFGTEYLLVSDKSLKSVGGCILERPDKMHTSPDMVILSECDEFEHTYRNGSYMCEEERISKIYDEDGICGKTMVVIRWNPDAYTVPEGYTKPKKAERHELMVVTMNFILAHPEVIQGKVHVFYLMFSPDNPKIAKHYPVSMIYDKSDLTLDDSGRAQVNTTMPTQLL